MFALGPPILLGSVSTRRLMYNTISPEKFNEWLGHKFGPIITSNLFYHLPKLSFDHFTRILENVAG